jgi:exodeoxyribonuclease VII large subunit
VLELKLDKIKSQSINKIHLALESELPAKLERLSLSKDNYLAQRAAELQGLKDLLFMLDPQRLLDRGYTISTVNDIDLNKENGDLIGSTMKTLTSSSIISSEIKAIKKK